MFHTVLILAPQTAAERAASVRRKPTLPHPSGMRLSLSLRRQRGLCRAAAFCGCLAAVGCAQLGYQAPPWDRTPTHAGSHW